MRAFCGFVVCLASMAQAQEATYRFSWQGGNGYTFEGALSFDAQRAGPIVRETDVTCFEVFGYRNEASIGEWNLSMLDGETTWRLHFLASESRFFVEGEDIWMPQAWNMRGDGRGCGPDGFGFNLGNIAQDICIDDQVVIASQVSPFQAFPAERDDAYRFGPNACHGPLLLGALEPPSN